MRPRRRARNYDRAWSRATGETNAARRAEQDQRRDAEAEIWELARAVLDDTTPEGCGQCSTLTIERAEYAALEGMTCRQGCVFERLSAPPAADREGTA